MWSVRGLRGGGGANRPVAGAVRAAVEALERRVLLDAALSGMVWQDTNGNGVRDGGEPVISGRTIYLDSNLNRLRDSGELFTTTNGSGIYTFAALPSGPYYVAQELPVGWEPTSPTTTFPGANEVAAGGVRDQVLPGTGQEKLTTSSSGATARVQGEVVSDPSPAPAADSESASLIRLPQFRSDPRFAGIDGSGQSVVFIDTGIDLDHPFFGPDSNADGVADRIVYHWDFADNDNSAQDLHGHGSLISSVAVSQSATYPGVAPGVNIIALKVFPGSSGLAPYSAIEQALQWAVVNAETYNVAAVNLSLGSGNYSTAQSLFGVGDELAALVGKNVVVSAASGNSYFEFQSPGVVYPAADPSALAIGGVYDANLGAESIQGATAHTTAPDRLVAFGQRSPELIDLVAPASRITGANQYGGTATASGTSAAAPYITGLAALAQQLALQHLGRRLSVAELRQVLRDAATPVHDGDDENDNVPHTFVDYARVDAPRMGEIILAMAPGTVQYYPLGHRVVVADANRTGFNFGSRQRTTPPAPPALHTASDTGWESSDRVTLFDNSTPNKRLAFAIGNVVPGATVTLYYAGGVLVGSTVATGTSAAIVTNGTTDIPDGVVAFTARQTFPGGSLGPASGSLSVTIDGTPPAVPNAPTLAAASDTGVSTSDRITSVNTPTLNFQSTDNFYRIYHNGVRIGTWDYEIGTSETLGTQPQGVQQYVLGALDRAGNETKSPPLILTIDSNSALGPVVPGSLDSGFGSGGVTFTSGGARDVMNAVTRQADGKYVVAGSMFEAGWVSMRLTVWRYNADGTPDTTFGTGGRVTTPVGDRSAGQDVQVLPDGKILVGGVGGNQTGSGGFFNVRTAMVRYHANGTLDSTFGSGGIIFRSDMSDVKGMVLMPDGKILAALGHGSNFQIGRFNTNGTLDTSFGASGGTTTIDIAGSTDITEGLVRQPDGKFGIVGGAFVSGSYHAAVARFTASGLIDTSFGDGGKKVLGLRHSAVARVAAQADGKVLVAYGSGTDGNLRVRRLNGDGSPDNAFATAGELNLMLGGGGARAGAVVVQPDGKIMVGGSLAVYLKPSGYSSSIVLRLNPDGTRDDMFGGGGVAAQFLTPYRQQDFVHGMLLQSDGRIVTVGITELGYDWQLAGLGTQGLITRYEGGDGAPRQPLDLQAGSDTGISSEDNITSDDTPTFDVPPLHGGYARLYRAGTLVVGGYASPMTWTPPGAQPEGAMTYGIGYVDPAGNESPRSDTTVIVDRIAPTGSIAAVGPVVQHAIEQITFTFTEPAYGFDTSDLTLEVDGAAAPVGAGVTLSTEDRITWTLLGLSEVTGRVGAYTIRTGTAITDAQGHALASPLSMSWRMNAILGTGGADTIRLGRGTSGGVEIEVNGAPAYTSTAADGFDELYVLGAAADDVLTIDHANGPLAFGGTIVFDGGTNGPAGDRLRFLGGDGDEAVAFAAGSAQLAETMLTLSAVEGLVLAGGGGNDALTASSGLITLEGSWRLASLSLAPPAVLDLADNDLVVDYASVSPVGIWTGDAYDGITGYIQSGRITSSLAYGQLTTLGVAESREALHITGSQTFTFAGESVDSTAVLVKFTWGGDANLDGKLNIDDYGRIDGNVAQSGVVFGYFNGDFNLDGKINIDDYGIIDGNINQQDDVL